MRRILPFIAMLVATAIACSLLQEAPPAPVVPTLGASSVPTRSPAMSLDDLRQQGGVIGSQFDAPVPRVDPNVQVLIDAISQQNLVGYIQTLESFGTRNTFSVTDRDDFGIGAARRWLAGELERVGNGRIEVNFQDYNFTFEGINTDQRNIVGILPGTSRQGGTFVLVANYDTRADDWLDGESLSPGADDNASGVATLLEIARLMSAQEWPHTVIFALMTAEEQGTFGSRHFVQTAFFSDVQITAALNNDMIGGRLNIPQSIRVYSIGPDDSGSRHFARYIHLINSIYQPSFPVTMMDGLDREGRWGDQREFVRAGIPAVRLIESQEDLSIQNSVRDNWQLIDYNYLQKSATVNLATLANMAGSPLAPPAPNVINLPEAGSYRVSWVIDNSSDGYTIVFRPLGDMTYEKASFHYTSLAEGGDVTIAGLDSNQAYGVSVAAVSYAGRLGLFSPETLVLP
ncbi:MAG TPA: M28 family metallopeptidase [Anaerolineae bacterium]|nr:M28 family metallopeptidase [Anaerolineae bacterium]